MIFYDVPNLSYNKDNTNGKNYLIVPLKEKSEQVRGSKNVDILFYPKDGVVGAIVDQNNMGGE